MVIDRRQFTAGGLALMAAGPGHAAGARPIIAAATRYADGSHAAVVYDLDDERTQWLAGGCGAWPRPEDDPGVLRAAAGLVAR